MKKNKGKDKNSVFLVIGILLVVGIITVGYAALQATLQINGTANIGGATWDIHFENIEETAATNVTANPAPSAPDDTTTTLTYGVNLVKPGDIYQFTAKIVNDGTIDARLDELVLSGASSLPYVSYTITYSDLSPIENDDTLLAEEEWTVLVTVQYSRTAVNQSDLPTDPIGLNLTAAFNFVQA